MSIPDLSSPISFADERTIETSHGPIALYDLPGPGTPLVMIHANSVSKESFRLQLEALRETRRVIAIDLPGHGASANAINPQRSYSIPGYANAVLEVLWQLGVAEFIVIGHSLGGHVALEMIALGAPVKGAFVFGTPPIEASLAGLQAGFKPSPDMAYTGSADITDEQIDMVLKLALGADAQEDEGLRAAVKRTDGRARQLMIEAVLAGQGSDQKALVETAEVPIAVINGEDDPVIDLDYIDRIGFANVWTGKPIRIAGAGHGLHRELPEQFNRLLLAFVNDIEMAG